MLAARPIAAPASAAPASTPALPPPQEKALFSPERVLLPPPLERLLVLVSLAIRSSFETSRHGTAGAALRFRRPVRPRWEKAKPYQCAAGRTCERCGQPPCSCVHLRALSPVPFVRCGTRHEGDRDESARLARQAGHTPRNRPRSRDRGAEGRDHQGDQLRDLRLGPPPL